MNNQIKAKPGQSALGGRLVDNIGFNPKVSKDFVNQWVAMTHLEVSLQKFGDCIRRSVQPAGTAWKPAASNFP